MDSVTRISRITASINGDLGIAIAAYETFVPTGKDEALIARVNAAAVHPGYNIISDSLHRNVVMTLSRLWDPTRRTARIPEVSRSLANPQIVIAIEKRWRSIDPQKLQRWQADAASLMGSDELSAVKRARDEALAHTADPTIAYPGTARKIVYGDERKVLEATIPLVAALNEFIGHTTDPYPRIRKMWKTNSDAFWMRVAPEK